MVYSIDIMQLVEHKETFIGTNLWRHVFYRDLEDHRWEFGCFTEGDWDRQTTEARMQLLARCEDYFRGYFGPPEP